MELFGFYVPGTRDKDKEIEQLRAYNQQLRDRLDRHQADYDRLERQHEDLRSRLDEVEDDLGEARARYNDLEGRFVDAQVGHEAVKAELERLQELAPYQVRHWDLTVRKACMTLEEAIEEASKPGRSGNVYITKREGDYNRMMTAEEIREATKGRESNQGQGAQTETANGREQDRKEFLRWLNSEDERDHPWRSKEEIAKELAQEAAQDAAEAKAENPPEQTCQPERARRQPQRQAPPPHVLPPHVLYRSPGSSRGMER
jgi:hypothetical protein